MNLPAYALRPDPNLFVFSFDSVGPRGRFPKLIRFTPLEDSPDFYNLAFGDLTTTGDLDDYAVSANGDAERILATVAGAALLFTDQRPEAVLFAVGSTRTRLYQMALHRYFEEVSEHFAVLGQLGTGDWEEFETGHNYEAFLATRRTA